MTVSITVSIFQPQSFPKYFSMLDITVAQVDLNTSLMSLLLIVLSAFEIELKRSYFGLSSLSIFLSTKTIVVKNLKPFN